MARQILGARGSGHTDFNPRSGRSAARTTIDGPALKQYLRRPRSARYQEEIAKLDADCYQADPTALRALIEAIACEFPELGPDEMPIGIVGKCYLGAPYEIHVCDLNGSIVEHFETYRRMPPTFEHARALAMSPGYAFVEVYRDSLRAVLPDGSVSVVKL